MAQGNTPADDEGNATALTDDEIKTAEESLKRGNHLPDGVVFDPAAELRGEPRFRRTGTPATPAAESEPAQES